MLMMTAVEENVMLDKIARHFVHSPMQLNALHESDAELICLPREEITTLSITTDSIVEEFASGLYDDPYLAGWMIVMANLSDLAAVGAYPIGLVLAETLPMGCTDEFIERLQLGAADACRKCGTNILGGDTNYAKQLALSGTAIGYQKQNSVTRIGCRPGDTVFASGLLGSGNGYALWKHLQSNGVFSYVPVARIREGQLLSRFATACMDTSDGVLATLDQLLRLNGCGFELMDDWKNLLEPQSSDIAKSCSIPEWLLFAGNHGEYELLFTIPTLKEHEFLRSAEHICWKPLRLGRVMTEPEIHLPLECGVRIIDTGSIRNLFSSVPLDIGECIKYLLHYDTTLRTEVHHV